MNISLPVRKKREHDGITDIYLVLTNDNSFVCECRDESHADAIVAALNVQLHQPWSTERLVDLLESAWGIIANVNRGNWDGEPRDWQVAAAQWRDKYHEELKALRPESDQ